MKKLVVLFICILIAIFPIFSDEINDFMPINEGHSDYVSDIIEILETNIQPLEETSKGTYDDGTDFTVYNISDDVKLTVSIDANETRYIVGNVNTPDVMQKITDLLSVIFPEPIPYLNSIVKDYKAAFYDSSNFYITDELPDYMGTFTILGSQLFVEEVRTQEKLIIQRQWCTLEYFKQCVQEIGEDWGFLASWDPEPQAIPFIEKIVEVPVNVEVEKIVEVPIYVEVEKIIEKQLLSNDSFIIYTVKQGDYLAKIAHEYYGDSHLWGLIYVLNKNIFPVQTKPELILPEMQLRIPSVEYIKNLLNFSQNN